MATFFNFHASGVPSLRPSGPVRKTERSSNRDEHAELIWAVALCFFFTAFFGLVVWLAANSPLGESREEGDTTGWYMGP